VFVTEIGEVVSVSIVIVERSLEDVIKPGRLSAPAECVES